jgi:hypothetical protein
VLDHLGPEVVADRVGIPARGPQQALDAVWAALADLLGEVPSVAALDRAEQASQNVTDTSADFRTGKAWGDPRVQRHDIVMPRTDLVRVRHDQGPPPVRGEGA